MRDSFLHLQCAATASRCTAMSVLVARLACLIGFLLLGYAAVDTIECACTTAAAAAAAVSSHGEPRLTQRTRFLLLPDRHTLQVSNQGFTWPRAEVGAAFWLQFGSRQHTSIDSVFARASRLWPRFSGARCWRCTVRVA